MAKKKTYDVSEKSIDISESGINATQGGSEIGGSGLIGMRKPSVVRKTKNKNTLSDAGNLFVSVPDADEITSLTPLFDITDEQSEKIEQDAISALPHAEPDPALLAYDPDEIEDTHESAEDHARYEAFLADYKVKMADILKNTAGTEKARDMELDDLIITDDEDELIYDEYDEDEPVTEDEWESISRAMNTDGGEINTDIFNVSTDSGDDEADSDDIDDSDDEADSDDIDDSDNEADGDEYPTYSNDEEEYIELNADGETDGDVTVENTEDDAAVESADGALRVGAESNEESDGEDTDAAALENERIEASDGEGDASLFSAEESEGNFTATENESDAENDGNGITEEAVDTEAEDSRDISVLDISVIEDSDDISVTDNEKTADENAATEKHVENEEKKDSTSLSESSDKANEEDGFILYRKDTEAEDLLTTADIWGKHEEPDGDGIYSEGQISLDIPEIQDTDGESSEYDEFDGEDEEYGDEYAQIEMDLGVDAIQAEHEKKRGYDPEKPRLIDTVFETVEMIVFTFIAVMVITGFFIRHSVVDGGSMERTLHDKDVLIISDFLYEPKRGDIVVFEDYSVSGESALIKRIIGIEGDTVKIEKNGTVYVNGEPLIEDYVYESMRHEYREGEWTVGEGEVFVLGDHRNNSRDSEDFGHIKSDGIIGRVLFRLYPFDSFGAVD